MHEPIDRRRFLSATAALAMLGAPSILVGCGDDADDGITPPPPTGPRDQAGSITNNHGHAAIITGAQITAGGEVSLNIAGGAPHAHQIVLTPQQVETIRNGGRVQVESTITEGLLGLHSHVVTFN